MKNKLITLAILVGVLVYFLLQASNRSDFVIYISASHDLFQGKDIYNIWYNDWYNYYYSVLFAIVIYPLSFLPIFVAQLIWLIINGFFLYRIIKIVATYFDSPTITKKQGWLLFGLGFVFALRFILGNFQYLQITICILYLVLEGLQFVFRGNKLAGAILIALGINIKILPIVILPYLLYRKEFLASLYIVAAYAVMMFFPVLIIGWERNNFLLTSWWSHVNPTTIKNILDCEERSFHSLSTLLATLLVEKVPDSHAMPIKRNIANISIEQLTYVLNISRLILISFSLYFFRTWPFKPQPDKIHRYWEVSYLLLLIPLIFPHQQHYAFLFICPAACYIFYYLITQKQNISKLKFRLLVVGMTISYLTGNLYLLLGVFNEYYMHFKILTYGALLMIPMLAVCVPKEPSAEPIN